MGQVLGLQLVRDVPVRRRCPAVITEYGHAALGQQPRQVLEQELLPGGIIRRVQRHGRRPAPALGEGQARRQPRAPAAQDERRVGH